MTITSENNETKKIKCLLPEMTIISNQQLAHLKVRYLLYHLYTLRKYKVCHLLFVWPHLLIKHCLSYNKSEAHCNPIGNILLLPKLLLIYLRFVLQIHWFLHLQIVVQLQFPLQFHQWQELIFLQVYKLPEWQFP